MKGTAGCYGKKKSPPVFGELLRQKYSHGQKFRNRDDSGVRNDGLKKVLVSGKEQVSVRIQRRTQDRPILEIADFLFSAYGFIGRGNELDEGQRIKEKGFQLSKPVGELLAEFPVQLIYDIIADEWLVRRLQGFEKSLSCASIGKERRRNNDVRV